MRRIKIIRTHASNAWAVQITMGDVSGNVYWAKEWRNALPDALVEWRREAPWRRVQD